MTRISRRSFGAVLCTLVCAAFLAGCSGNPLDTPSVEEARQARLAAMSSELTADDLVEAGHLTVGLITSDGAPYVMESSGGYQGIDVDVAAALAQRLGLQVKFQPIDDAAAAALNRVDVVMGVTSEQAAGQVVASDFVEQAIGFFTLGEQPTVTSAEALSGKTVALQEGSASQQQLNRSNLTMEQRGYPNIDEAMNALKAGEVNYVCCPVYPGAYLADEMGGICFCGTLDVPTTQGVGVASGSQVLAEAVQMAMDDIRDNGVIGIILHKWVGDLPRLTAASQVTGVVLSDGTPAPEQPAEGVAADGSEAGSNAVSSEDLPEGAATEADEEGQTTDTTGDGTGTTQGTLTPANGAGGQTATTTS